VLPVSARSPDALCALAGEYADVVEAAVDTDRVVDTCFSAGARRSHHTYRAAVIGADREVLADGLRSAAAGSPAPSVVAAAGLSTGPPRTVFVFPGQGAQWVGMGRELLAVNESFADRLRECDDAIEAELGWSLIDRLHDDDPFTMVDEIQPALWAMQVSIAQVWRDWGVEPGLVIGHSMGEIAAAVTAGALTVRQGASVVCRRSSLLRDLRGLGSMWAVQLGEEAARAAIGEFADRVCVGVVNSDHSTVLSGDPDLLAEIVAPLEERGVFCRRVHVDYASHAPQVEAIRHRMLDALSGLRPRRGRLPLYSTVLERIVDGAEMDGGYWTANLRQVVRFASGVRHALSGGGHTLFVEVSPHPLLVSAIEDGIEATGAEATVIPSLHRDRPEPESLLAGLGMAYVHGCAPDWRRIYPDGRFVPVPGHPWQRKRHWIDSLDAVADNAVADNAVAGNGAAGNVAAEPSSDATARPAPAERHGSGPPPESELVLARRVVDHASDVLAMTPGEIDQNAPLTLAGLDSLLAAKLRTRLAAELGVQVSVRELLSARSPRELADGLSERIRLMHGHRETHGA
jgi:acyl transferase domain-containing protein